MCCPLLKQLPCLRLRTLTQQQEIHGDAGPEFEGINSVNFSVLKLRHRNSPLNQNTRVSQLRVKPSMHSWNQTEASIGGTGHGIPKRWGRKSWNMLHRTGLYDILRTLSIPFEVLLQNRRILAWCTKGPEQNPPSIKNTSCPSSTSIACPDCCKCHMLLVLGFVCLCSYSFQPSNVPCKVSFSHSSTDNLPRLLSSMTRIEIKKGTPSVRLDELSFLIWQKKRIDHHNSTWTPRYCNQAAESQRKRHHRLLHNKAFPSSCLNWISWPKKKCSQC